MVIYLMKMFLKMKHIKNKENPLSENKILANLLLTAEDGESVSWRLDLLKCISKTG